MNSEIFERLAKLVKTHRKQAGLSQLELAEYAGVGKTVIFDIEHAKRTVRLDTVVKVLTTLNINIELKGPL